MPEPPQMRPSSRYVCVVLLTVWTKLLSAPAGTGAASVLKMYSPIGPLRSRVSPTSSDEESDGDFEAEMRESMAELGALHQHPKCHR